MGKITRDELLTELNRLANELDKVPTRNEMNEHGEYSRSPYDRVFGGWNDALGEAGLEVNKPVDLTREQLLRELERVAGAIDKAPTMDEFRFESKWTERAYKREFGTWNDALRAAGLEVNKQHGANITKQCPECGDEFSVKPSTQSLRQYCSRSCLMSSRTGEQNPHPNAGKRIEKTCEWCGDTFEVNVSKADTARFCSLDCLGKHNGDVRSGKDSPRWRGGHEDYYGPNWDAQRQERLKKDGHECLHCGKESVLIVHHVTPYREFVNDDGTVNYEEAHRVENLRTYCRTCHAKIENREANEFGV